jgi:hypothetical protein
MIGFPPVLAMIAIRRPGRVLVPEADIPQSRWRRVSSGSALSGAFIHKS